MQQPDRPTRVGEYLVPRSATPGTCKSCGAEILWIVSRLGRPIPLSVATIEQDAGGARFALTHFADCPNAKQHRLGKTMIKEAGER